MCVWLMLTACSPSDDFLSGLWPWIVQAVFTRLDESRELDVDTKASGIELNGHV